MPVKENLPGFQRSAVPFRQLRLSDDEAAAVLSRPEFQHLAPGDVVPMSPNGKHGMRVQHVDAPHSMIWGTPGDTTWAWQLEERPDGSTRLITRVRSRYRWFSPSVAFSLLLEFADVWMMRKMLLNLRARSEGVQLKTNKPQAQQ